MSITPCEVDVQLDNDGDCIVIADGAVCDLGTDRHRWRRAVSRGHLLPVTIPHACYTAVRVVLGPLDARLASASVASARHSLEVTAGSLIVSSSREVIEHHADRARTFTFALPSGSYLVDLHLLACGISGLSCVFDAGHRPGAWWDRSRPGEPRPGWLRRLLSGLPDPEGETDLPGADDRDARALEVVIHVDRLAGAPPPRQALDLVQGDFLLPSYTVRLPERCPDAVLASRAEQVDEVGDAEAVALAAGALSAALDEPTAAERASEEIEDLRLAEAQRAYQAHMASLRGEMKRRGDEARERKATALAARSALPPVGRVHVWCCDLALEKPELAAVTAAADRAAAELGLAAIADLLLGVDGDEDLWLRIHAAPAGDTYALYGVGLLAQGFDVVSVLADGRVLATTASGDEGQARSGVLVRCCPEISALDLPALWEQHRDHRASVGGASRPVVTDPGALAMLLALPAMRDWLVDDDGDDDDDDESGSSS